MCSRKREIAVSTTGIFAMQALMEAVTVAGTSQYLSHSDLAKCIWLLTLDDVGDVPIPLVALASGINSQLSVSQASSTAANASVGCSSSQQRLARTFEERASRVHPDAFLPWLPSLAVCLLRPEGRFVASALRGIMLSYPTALASVSLLILCLCLVEWLPQKPSVDTFTNDRSRDHMRSQLIDTQMSGISLSKIGGTHCERFCFLQILRGLLHQLTSEVERDRRISVALAELPPDRRRRLDEVYGSGDASGQRLGTHFNVGDDDTDIEVSCFPIRTELGLNLPL